MQIGVTVSNISSQNNGHFQSQYNNHCHRSTVGTITIGIGSLCAKVILHDDGSYSFVSRDNRGDVEWYNGMVSLLHF